MTRHVRQILCVSLLVFFLSRCAQIVPLGGGKRDTTPPTLLEAIPAQKTTNFNSEKIVLLFDEFVQLKDLPNQMIVSPKLKTPVEVSAQGRKVEVTLKKDELRPNTTYRIFFGKAIADMHESNSIPGFEYVFSTGNHIDTLKLRGNVVDAFTTKPVGNVLVGLYPTGKQNDSIVFKESPDYLAQSNENGEFFFSSLPPKKFRVMGFTDKNRNQVYDGESEKVCFLGEELQLESDSTLNMKLFQEEPVRTFIKKTQNLYYGLTWVLLNRKIETKVKPLNSNDSGNIHQVAPLELKDTVQLYYKEIKDTLHLVVSPNGAKTDTLHLTLPRNPVTKKRLKAFGTNLQGSILPVNTKLKLVFQTWMDTTQADLSRVKFSSPEDSLVSQKSLTGRWRSITEYEMDLPLKEGTNYVLKADTNTFFDVYGISNDTLPVRFNTQSKTDLGTVHLKMRFHKKRQYVVQLLNEQQQVVRTRTVSFALSSSNAETIDFTDLPPATYQVKVICDDNKNQKWDTGHLISGKQPEQVIVVTKQIKVLSDWEIEEEILIKE